MRLVPGEGPCRAVAPDLLSGHSKDQHLGTPADLLSGHSKDQHLGTPAVWHSCREEQALFPSAGGVKQDPWSPDDFCKGRWGGVGSVSVTFVATELPGEYRRGRV